MGSSLKPLKTNYDFLFSYPTNRDNKQKNYKVKLSWGIIYISNKNFQIAYRTVMNIITAIMQRDSHKPIMEVIQEEGTYG